ncbi:extracellular solute-binding protein [Anaerocolumna sedimenticola]|uniref:Extracellular solute-binding protein n=1 Tax=Anaerocolumna sedimenticola TaxID=2696063 RepID=A0A6P1TKK8_9FIRM|nr:extracellular solute-binding protein [Anaerocolumna sedimenticola]QHQ60827.1 extracellular solute-binding protein [Anaerocolumna sedimenticola]
MKKVIALLMTMMMLVSLAACGKKDSSTSTDNTAPAATEAATATEATETPAATEAPDVSKSEPTNLTMWCIAVESDSNRHAYETAIADFQKAHPDINLKWEATQNQDYKTKIKAAVAANELPDIFFTWGGGFLREFVDAGRVYGLDDVYANYSSELPDKVLTNHKFDGKLYAVPTNYNAVAMFANMELLKQAGFDKVPGTYEELLACCDALVAKGIIPFGCSGKETWCVTEYLESIIEKSVGAAALTDMYLGKTPWNNEGVIKAVDSFQEMIKKQYFDPEGIALSNDEVKANFIAGKYAFYINGTWNCASFVDIADKVQVAEFPVIDSTKSQLGELIGGPSDSLAVSASSKSPEIAAMAAFELAKSVCKYGYLDGNGLPAWTQDPNGDYSSVNPLTLSVAEIMNNSKQSVLFGDGIQSADNANIYLDYVSQIYASAIDGKAFVEGLDKDLKK